MVNEIALGRLNFLHIIFSVLQLSVDIHITVLIGSILPDRVMLCITDKECNTINALACDRINFVNEHGRSLSVGNSQQSLFSVFHFDMLWFAVKGIAFCSLRFNYRIPTGFQIGKCDFAVTVGAVCADTLSVHFAYFKRNIFDWLSGFFVNLGNNKVCFLCIEKFNGICFSAFNLNGLCIVLQNISLGCFGFLHNICSL